MKAKDTVIEGLIDEAYKKNQGIMPQEFIDQTIAEISFKAGQNTMEADNKTLRKLLWLHHGCPVIGLYGDDGEMQCAQSSKHIIDFRRMPVAQIEYWLMNEEGRAFVDHIRQSKPNSRTGG